MGSCSQPEGGVHSSALQLERSSPGCPHFAKCGHPGFALNATPAGVEQEARRSGRQGENVSSDRRYSREIGLRFLLHCPVHTLQSVNMSSLSADRLRPTLWRTCRALANRRRLAILRLLSQRAHLNVSAVAREFGWPIPVASQYLRALNARGLLSVSRVGRCVHYSTGSDETVPESAELLTAVAGALRAGTSTERIFRALTSCTHPRRIEVFRHLSQRPMTLGQLRKATGASRPALLRHLKKLIARRWVREADDGYHCRRPRDRLAQCLMRLATR